MSLFRWSESYSIGNKEIDDQHKELFDKLNKIYDISYEPDKIDSVHAILDELIAYSDYHFKAEQKYMTDIGYEDIGKQLIEHDYFINEVLRLKESTDMNSYELTKETIVFLGRWLLNHIIVEDNKIISHHKVKETTNM